MSGIFVNPDDEIIVRIVVARNKHGAIFTENSMSLLKETYQEDEIDESTIEEFEAVFRQPSFKDAVELSTEFSLSTTNEASVDFNPVDARFRKMSKLLKSWTFKEEDGTAVPPTEENVAKLHPTIATVIGNTLDAQVPMV